MKPFKFLNPPLMKTHDGHLLFAGEEFYSVNKEDYVSYTGRTIAKYTAVKRIVPLKFRDKFIPDHDLLWYFKSKHNMEYLINTWKGLDELEEEGNSLHRNSDIIITFSR
jgi:hypothetical protein